MATVLATNGTRSFTASPPKPVGTFTGPGIVVIRGCFFYSPGTASCTGFSSAAQVNDTRATETTNSFVIYRVVANLGSEPSSYAVSVSAGGDLYTQVTFLQNDDGTAPSFLGASTVGQPNTATPNVPDVNNTEAGAISLLAAGSWNTGQWNTGSPPSGFSATPAATGSEFCTYGKTSLPTGNVGGSFSSARSRFAIVQAVFVPGSSPPPEPLTPTVSVQERHRQFRARRPVDQWDPLPALIPQPAPARWGFSAGLAFSVVAPTVHQWEPLPGLPATPTPRVAVGSAPTVHARRRATRVDAWEPLPGLPATPLAAVAPECCSPLPPQRRAARPDAWGPLAPLARSGAHQQAAQPSRLRSPRVDGWAPLPAAIVPPAVPRTVECQPPVPPRRRSPRVDPWQPLGGLAVAPPALPGASCDSPVPPRRKRAPEPGWNVVGPIGDACSFSDSPRGRVSRRMVSEGWEPLPSLPVAVVLGFVFSASSGPTRARRASVEPWDVAPPLVAPAPGYAFSSQPLSRSRPVRVDAWEPLPDIPVLPDLPDWAGSVAIPPRLRPVRVDAWEPLPSLIPPAPPPPPYHPLPAPRQRWQNMYKQPEERRVARVDAWGILETDQIVASAWSVFPLTLVPLTAAGGGYSRDATWITIGGGTAGQLYQAKNTVDVLLASGETRRLVSVVWVWVEDR